MTISDHLWPEDSPTFPSSREYYEYLSSYVSKHNLLQYFQFNTSVTLLEKVGNSYSVTYQNPLGTFTKVFKYVLIATGLYSKPNHTIINPQKFSGTIIHAGQYRNPSAFTGKKVAVVGISFSASDIACEALQTAQSVTQIYRKKVLFAKRIINGTPIDFFMSSFKSINDKRPLEYNIETNAFNARTHIQNIQNPGELLEEWRITEEEIGSRYFLFPIVCDEYFEAVKRERINYTKGNAVEFCGNGVVLDNGQVVEADVVVMGTGYLSDFEFLEESLRDLMKYDPSDRKFPLVRFRSCLHPELPGLAFVGNYYTLITSHTELSAEIGVRWIKGLLNVSKEELWEGVRLEERQRVETRNPVWAYDLRGLLQEFFRILNITFHPNLLQSLEYTTGPLSPVFFFQGRENQLDLIKEFVRQIKLKYPNYPFNNPPTETKI